MSQKGNKKTVLYVVVLLVLAAVITALIVFGTQEGGFLQGSMQKTRVTTTESKVMLEQKDVQATGATGAATVMKKAVSSDVSAD